MLPLRFVSYVCIYICVCGCARLPPCREQCFQPLFFISLTWAKSGVGREIERVCNHWFPFSIWCFPPHTVFQNSLSSPPPSFISLKPYHLLPTVDCFLLCVFGKAHSSSVVSATASLLKNRRLEQLAFSPFLFSDELFFLYAVRRWEWAPHPLVSFPN